MQSANLYCFSINSRLGLRTRFDKNSSANPKSYLDSSLRRFGYLLIKHGSIFYLNWRIKYRAIWIWPDLKGNNQRWTNCYGKRKRQHNLTPLPSYWSWLYARGFSSNSSNPSSNQALIADRYFTFPNCRPESVRNLYVWHLTSKWLHGPKWINHFNQPKVDNYWVSLYNYCVINHGFITSAFGHYEHLTYRQQVQSASFYCLSIYSKLRLRYWLFKDSCANPKSYIESSLWRFGCIQFKHGSIFYLCWRN